MRVGPGNIIGVTGAIAVGGPGALFWMWLSAFFGMSIAYIEAVLSQIFKEKNDLGLVFSSVPCNTGAVYTQNKEKGAPILVTKKNLEATGGISKAIIVNSKNANTCNADGEQKAERMSELAAVQCLEGKVLLIPFNRRCCDSSHHPSPIDSNHTPSFHSSAIFMAATTHRNPFQRQLISYVVISSIANPS